MKTTEPGSSSSAKEVKRTPLVSKPNEDDKDTFFEELSCSGGSPVILSLIASCNEVYILLYEAGKVMKPLIDLHSV